MKSHGTSASPGGGAGRTRAARSCPAGPRRSGPSAVDRPPLEVDALAVALHVELLQVRGEAREVLVVRQHGDGGGVEEVVVPEADECQEDGQVLLERRAPEVLVHGVVAAEHLGETLGPTAIISESPMADGSE
jgi:hypothetical protein